MSDDHRAIYLYEDDLVLAHEIVADAQREVTLLRYAHEVEAVLRAGKASAIIMDRLVDVIDSIAMVGRLRSEGERVPVVMISSLASVDERIRCLKAGGDDYLVKPFAHRRASVLPTAARTFRRRCRCSIRPTASSSSGSARR